MKVEVRAHNGYAEVYIDGKEISHVTSISYKQGVQEAAEVKLTLLPSEVILNLEDAEVVKQSR